MTASHKQWTLLQFALQRAAECWQKLGCFLVLFSLIMTLLISRVKVYYGVAILWATSHTPPTQHTARQQICQHIDNKLPPPPLWQDVCSCTCYLNKKFFVYIPHTVPTLWVSDIWYISILTSLQYKRQPTPVTVIHFSSFWRCYDSFLHICIGGKHCLNKKNGWELKYRRLFFCFSNKMIVRWMWQYVCNFKVYTK